MTRLFETLVTRRLPARLKAVAAGAALLAGAAQAATVAVDEFAAAAVTAPGPVVTRPFVNVENRAVNSLGFVTGARIRFGADGVVPNGAAGTTGQASTVDTATGAGFNRAINFVPAPVIPNFFSNSTPFNAGLLGPWTLKFSNGGVTTEIAMPALPAGTAPLPFVDSITLSGTTERPTFTWAPPAGQAVQGYRINIFDKSLVGPSSSGQVTSRNLGPEVRSYTVTPEDFTVPGYAMQLGKNYVIEITALQTRNGLSNNLGNSNLASASRVYADFTPRAGGERVVNLPVLTEGGAFQFNMAVAAGQTYYIDPEVATGYDYAIGAGDPHFASVMIPDNLGDGLYTLWGFDDMGQSILLDGALPWGQVYQFGAGGVSRFRITGIETSAMLDPADTTAFVTGVTFAGAGQFTGTQTPITQFVAGEVPEPASAALLLAGLAGLGLMRRRGRGEAARN